MVGDGAMGKDWLKARGASPVSYRHNFLDFFYCFLFIMYLFCFLIIMYHFLVS